MFKRQKQHKASVLIIAVLISGIVFYTLNGEVIGNENEACLWCKLEWGEEQPSPERLWGGKGVQERGGGWGCSGDSALLLASSWGGRWALGPHLLFGEVCQLCCLAWRLLCLLLSLEAGGTCASPMGGGCWQGCRTLSPFLTAGPVQWVQCSAGPSNPRAATWVPWVDTGRTRVGHIHQDKWIMCAWDR